MKQHILFLSLVPFIPFSCLVALASISGSSRLEVVVRGLTPEAGAALVAVSGCVAPGRAAALGAVGRAASLFGPFGLAHSCLPTSLAG